jgi:hypothetical protein
MYEINERYNLQSKSSEAIWDWDITTTLFGKDSTLFGYEFGTFSQNNKIWESNIHPMTTKTVNQINIANRKFCTIDFRISFSKKKSDGKICLCCRSMLIIKTKK